MKNSTIVIKKVTAVVFYLAFAALVTTFVLSILQISNKIDVGPYNLLIIGLIPALSLGLIGCIGYLITQFMKYREQKRYVQEESNMMANIQGTKKEIVRQKTNIEQQRVNFLNEISRFREELEQLNVMEDCCEMSDPYLKYLDFIEGLVNDFDKYCKELSHPQYSDYGNYRNYTSFRDNQFLKICERFNDELPKEYNKVKEAYKKIFSSGIIGRMQGTVNNKFITFLVPEKYNFVKEFLTLQMNCLKSIANLPELRRRMVDLQYRLGAESMDDIILDLVNREQGQDQDQARAVQPSSSSADPTITVDERGTSR